MVVATRAMCSQWETIKTFFFCIQVKMETEGRAENRYSLVYFCLVLITSVHFSFCAVGIT